MAIFSRRTLNRLINENAKFLSKKQTQRHVKELNAFRKDPTLSTEWEVVLLNALSKIGKVEHEKDFPGSTRFADVYFETLDDFKQTFVAEIVTVSDSGLHKSNPYHALVKRLNKEVKNKDLDPNRFSVEVEGNEKGHYKGGSKVRLKLPGPARFSQIIFNEDFETFLAEIRGQPSDVRRLPIKSDDIDLTIIYSPRQTHSGGAYLDYTVVYLLTENPVYQALSSKVNQLTSTNFDGPKGIFLCDGGCRLFDRRSQSRQSYTIDEVIADFVNQNPEIDFVVTVTVEWEPALIRFLNTKSRVETLKKLYKGRQFDSRCPFVSTIANRMYTALPTPQIDPYNALGQLEWEKERQTYTSSSHWGGCKVSYLREVTEIRISARALLGLLAGKVDQEEFLKGHHFVSVGKKTGENPFGTALHFGKLIDEVSLEKSQEKDDDWIVFRLKGPDPAISPFVVPETKR